MKFLYFTLLVIIMSSCNNDNLVRFDGLYESSDSILTDHTILAQHYLRFYPNGKVIGVTSTGSAFQITPWFHLSSTEKNFSEGHYTINKKRIEFSTTSESGTVVYEGEFISETLLNLKFKSLINGHEGNEKYSFVEVPDLK